MVHKHHIEEVAGGRERTLSEKVPDSFEVKTQTQTKRAPIITPGVHLTGAMEIHRLAVENKLNLSLKGREAELTVDIINATCTTDGWTIKCKLARMIFFLNILSCPRMVIWCRAEVHPAKSIVTKYPQSSHQVFPK